MDRLHPESMHELRKLVKLHGSPAIRQALLHIDHEAVAETRRAKAEAELKSLRPIKDPEIYE